MNAYLIFILFVLIGSFLLNTIVECLSIRHLQPVPPDEFTDTCDAQTYAVSQNYLRETTRFGIATDTIVTAVTVVFILAGGFSLADRIARSPGMGEIPTGMVFLGMLLLASHLLHIPFSAWQTFVIEEKYGFNTTTPRTFILDILKVWLLAALVGGAFFALIIWLFDSLGRGAWVLCWGALGAFQVLLLYCAPAVIMPLFNTFTPLADGPLKESIEAFSRSQRFKIKGIFTMDGSKRSSKSNAFFTGIGTFKRIVLFDTLVEKHSVDEILAVLAHETGHYKKKHVLQQLAVSLASGGLMLYVLSLFLNNRGLFDAFGVEHLSVYASLVFFGFLYAPLDMLLGIAVNALSRNNEYEADAFAVAAQGSGEPMISALKKLSVDNYANLTPHPLKVMLSYSHPPVMERIRHIRSIRPSACPGT